MTKTLLSFLLLSTLALSARAQTNAPLFVETFNADAGSVELRNGAILGADASGASGLAGDRAYTANVSDFTNADGGPVALIRNPIVAAGLEEVTVAAWYKPATQQSKDVTLFDFASMVFIGDRPEQWTARLEAKVEEGKQYWFYSGKEAPAGGWLRPNEWTFLAFTWSRAANQGTFYGGTKTDSVAQTRQVTHALAPQSGLQERANRARILDAIGNTRSAKYNRPFNGAMDNVRVYGKALSREQLETIRAADLQNALPVVK